MYAKNLTEDLRLRLSTTDMDFLRELSKQRSVSISECIRSIIAQYRQATETLDVLRRFSSSKGASDLQGVISMAVSTAGESGQVQSSMKGEGLSNGDTKTDINHKL